MTLDVYSHVLPHMQYEAMNKLNDLLANRDETTGESKGTV